jgi:hypothetical protein
MQAVKYSKTLQLYKELVREVRSNRSLVASLRSQFKQHDVTPNKLCKHPGEMFFVAQTYLTYLKSTREHLALKQQYHKGERSTEEAAKIVGLRLPKTYQE